MKKFVIILGVLIIISLSTVWAVSAIFSTNDEYTYIAVNNSMQLNLDKEDENKILERLNEAIEEANNTRVYSRNTEIRMSQINTKYIVPFGAQTNYDIALMNTKDHEQKITYDVYVACENILYNKKKVEIEKVKYDIQLEKLDISSIQYEKQIIDEIAFLTQEHAVEVARRAYNNSLNSLKQAKQKLNSLLGNEINSEIDVEGELIRKAVLDIDIDDLVKDRIAVDTYTYQLKRNLEQNELEMSYVVEYYESDEDEYKSLKYSLDYNELKYGSQENNLELSLRAKYFSLLDAYEYIDIALLSLNIEEMKYEEALIQYEKGVNTQKNVFYKRDSYVAAKMAYYSAIYSANLKTAEFVYLLTE